MLGLSNSPSIPGKSARAVDVSRPLDSELTNRFCSFIRNRFGFWFLNRFQVDTTRYQESVCKNLGARFYRKNRRNRFLNSVLARLWGKEWVGWGLCVGGVFGVGVGALT